MYTRTTLQNQLTCKLSNMVTDINMKQTKSNICWKVISAKFNIYTHTHLMALCPGLPGSAGTRKLKPIWILLKQETVSVSGISWAICKSAPRSRQITTPITQFFYRLDALPAAQPTASKHWIKLVSTKSIQYLHNRASSTCHFEQRWLVEHDKCQENAFLALPRDNACTQYTYYIAYILCTANIKQKHATDEFYYININTFLNWKKYGLITQYK